MFRKSSEQTNIFTASSLLSPIKQQRLERTWASLFRDRCLPLIPEEDFASYYCADNGRPNVPIRIIVGLLILKQIFNYTDQAALDAADFDARWQTALGLSADDPVPCQKTLHNFRALLMQHDAAAYLFAYITDKLINELDLKTQTQRIDSTQIISNIALLSRLERFCETHRILLNRLTRYCPSELSHIPLSVQRRYVGTEAPYEDAPSSDSHRRLAVCARDCWRLIDALRGIALPPKVAEAYALVVRLFDDQCLVVEDPPSSAPGDADHDETPVPVRPRVKTEFTSGIMQSPHDPDATYGHKGVGYSVVICETVGNGEKPELITYIELANAYGSDQKQTIPAVNALKTRGNCPDQLLGDTSFGSTENLIECQETGTKLIAPIAVNGEVPTPDIPIVYASCLPDAPPSACSMGVEAIETIIEEKLKHPWVQVTFSAAGCAECPKAACCPALQQADGTRVFTRKLKDAINVLRRLQITQDAFKETYRWRAGIEATNSELKRSHGFGRLRVRGKAPVKLDVLLKGLACNCKRSLKYWMEQRQTVATAQAS